MFMVTECGQKVIYKVSMGIPVFNKANRFLGVYGAAWKAVWSIMRWALNKCNPVHWVMSGMTAPVRLMILIRNVLTCLIAMRLWR